MTENSLRGRDKSHPLCKLSTNLSPQSSHHPMEIWKLIHHQSHFQIEAGSSSTRPERPRDIGKHFSSRHHSEASVGSVVAVAPAATLGSKHSEVRMDGHFDYQRPFASFERPYPHQHLVDGRHAWSTQVVVPASHHSEYCDHLSAGCRCTGGDFHTFASNNIY